VVRLNHDRNLALLPRFPGAGRIARLRIITDAECIVTVSVTLALLALAARYAHTGLEEIISYALTWLLLLSGVRVAVAHGVNAGDAGNLSRTTHIPRLIWALLWLAGTLLAVVIGGKWLVLRSSPDPESADSLGRFGLHADVLHHGGAGAAARPLHQAADFPVRSLEDRLDPAVREVPHPAAHAVPLGHPAAGVAEEDTLHATRDQHPIANHTDTLRPAALFAEHARCGVDYVDLSLNPYARRGERRG
jgi:hypothetical protein